MTRISSRTVNREGTVNNTINLLAKTLLFVGSLNGILSFSHQLPPLTRTKISIPRCLNQERRKRTTTRSTTITTITPSTTYTCLYHSPASPGNHENNFEINYLDNSRLDSEERPKRLVKKNKKHEENKEDAPNSVSSTHDGRHLTAKEQKFSKWGVEKHRRSNDNGNNTSSGKQGKDQINCPSTLNSVAQDCFHAVSSTLYCRNFLDPNIASNAMAVSVNDKRPVGFAYWPEGRDVGRLGVEIDHARYLLSDFNDRSSISSSHNSRTNNKRHQYADIEGRALRRVVLLLASKLSQKPWDGLEKKYREDTDIDDNAEGKEKDMELENEKQTRPIAVFFNTLSQALLASRELQLLQQVARRQNQDVSNYKNIRILCLGQDTIPEDMIRPKNDGDNGKPRRRWGSSRELSSGKVDPKKGLVLVVQPTDYNYELNPPSPSIGTVQELQKILSRASVNQIPSIVVSPRLTEQFEGQMGIEQSGYQQSSTYGGVEPPKGPTPWLLRDFIPPVYSWVGCALELSSRRPSLVAVMESIGNKEGFDDNDLGNNNFTYSYYSRLAMTQTVMESGHPWHLYAVEKNVEISSDSTEEKDTFYEYIASTNPHSGRPSTTLLEDILSEFT